MKLKRLFELRSKSVIFDSKVKQIDENEKCSRFFYKKVFDGSRIMLALKDEDGQVEKDTEGMINATERFYSGLHEKKRIDEGMVRSFLDEVDGKVWEGEFLEKDLALEEIPKALKS